jgi:hypothetical protein
MQTCYFSPPPTGLAHAVSLTADICQTCQRLDSTKRWSPKICNFFALWADHAGKSARLDGYWQDAPSDGTLASLVVSGRIFSPSAGIHSD